jgi:hypothetical protein
MRYGIMLVGLWSLAAAGAAAKPERVTLIASQLTAKPDPIPAARMALRPLRGSTFRSRWRF